MKHRSEICISIDMGSSQNLLISTAMLTKVFTFLSNFHLHCFWYFSIELCFFSYIFISFSKLSVLTSLLSYYKVLTFLLISAILKIYSVLEVKL